MSKIFIFPILFMVFLLSGAQSCAKAQEKMNEKTLMHNGTAKVEASFSCKNDDDCTSVNEDCCGCNQGGSKRAIAKEELKKVSNELSSRCAGTMCMQVISKHESCRKKSVCRSGACVLE